MEKNIILEIKTVNNSIYKIYKINKDFILKSDTEAFNDIDFIVLKKVYIEDKINFIGTIYKNAIIKKGLFKINIKPQKNKTIIKTNMNLTQTTSKINTIKIKNHKLYKNIKENNILLID